MPEIANPIESNEIDNVVSSTWYTTFIKNIILKKDGERNILSNENLRKLIMAADFLDIKQLLNLGCATMATIVKDRTKEDLYNEFSVPMDSQPQPIHT